MGSTGTSMDCDVLPTLKIWMSESFLQEPQEFEERNFYAKLREMPEVQNRDRRIICTFVAQYLSQNLN